MNKVFKNKEIKIDDNVIKLNIDDSTVEKVIDFYNEAPLWGSKIVPHRCDVHTAPAAEGPQTSWGTPVF